MDRSHNQVVVYNNPMQITELPSPPTTDIYESKPWKMFIHPWATQMLQEHLRSGQARHAYLITGPEGVGRRTLGLRFIQGMNCPNPSEPGVPCLQSDCRTCRQIESMQHADLKVIRVPEGKSEIPIDLVRELQGFMMLTPYESPYKIGLLINFNQATIQAQNALLKTLEEAPDRARLILTADSAENLLPTIVSRCELIRLRPLALGVVTKALVEHHEVDPDRAVFLDHISGGRYGYALRLMNDSARLTRREEDIQDLVRVMNASLRERFQYVDQLFPRRMETAVQRQRAREAIQSWQSLFRDVLLVSSGSITPVMNIDFTSLIKSLCNKLSPADADRWIKSCDLALTRIDGYCAVRLTMENLLLGDEDEDS